MHGLANFKCAYSIRWYMSNRFCWLLASGNDMELRFHLVTASKQPADSDWHIPDAVCTVLDSWWWTERPSETCRVLLQNKINLRNWCIWLVLLWKVNHLFYWLLTTFLYNFSYIFVFIYNIILFYIVLTNHTHFLPVLYIYVMEEMSFSKVIQKTVWFFSWVLVYRSDDGPKMSRNYSPQKCVCAIHDGTLSNTLINPATLRYKQVHLIWTRAVPPLDQARLSLSPTCCRLVPRAVRPE